MKERRRDEREREREMRRERERVRETPPNQNVISIFFILIVFNHW